MDCLPSVWCSKYYIFHDFLHNLLQKLFQFILLFFLSIYKNRNNEFECPKSIRNLKKIILRTSDAWSTSRLSHLTSKPAYYIVDCRILEHWDDGNDLILSRCHLSLLLPSLAYYFPFALELIKNRESESKRQHSETNCREKHKLKHSCMNELLLGGIF